MLPVLFLSHGGGPAHFLDYTNSSFQAIDKNSPSRAFLQSLPATIESFSPPGIAPQCILVVSAHWEEPNFTVDYQPRATTQLVYDYFGFPDEAYAPHLTYPVKTNLQVADRVVGLLQENGLVVQKKDRGFDHGVFIPLKVAYPDANVPVVQLSLKYGLSMAEHIYLGEVLRPLRKEGVLIVTSGQITHNLRESRKAKDGDDPRTVEFLHFMNTFLGSVIPANYEQSKEVMTHIADHAPEFYWAHPRPEHFVPLGVAFGASYVAPETQDGGNKKPFFQRLYTEIVMGSMGIDSYLWT